MRGYYHRRANAEVVLRTKSYQSRTSGGEIIGSCAWCERSFVTTRRRKEGHGRTYCSLSCKEQQRRAMERHRRATAKPRRRCPHCGNDLISKLRADAVYCSARCNSAAHQQTRKASAKTGARERRIDRASVIERDGGVCHICGAQPEGADLTIDHVVPLAKGGTHTYENLAVACLSCNCRKGARLVGGTGDA